MSAVGTGCASLFAPRATHVLSPSPPWWRARLQAPLGQASASGHPWSVGAKLVPLGPHGSGHPGPAGQNPQWVEAGGCLCGYKTYNTQAS